MRDVTKQQSTEPLTPVHFIASANSDLDIFKQLTVKVTDLDRLEARSRENALEGLV